MSVFVPVAHCFYCCSLVVFSEVQKGCASSFVLFFFRIALAILGPLWFHVNFRVLCSSSVKNVLGNLIGSTLSVLNLRCYTDCILCVQTVPGTVDT